MVVLDIDTADFLCHLQYSWMSSKIWRHGHAYGLPSKFHYSVKRDEDKKPQNGFIKVEFGRP